MSPKFTQFGKNLRFLRLLKGLSQAKLAKELNLTRNKLASYESGMIEPNAKVFLHITNYFEEDPHGMLENDLSEINAETSSDEIHPILSSYLADHINEFTHQTNQISKILDGYKIYYDLQKSKYGEHDQEVYPFMENILELLEDLLKSNWDLIQSIHPHEEEE